MATLCPFLNRRAEAHAGREELFEQECGSDPDVQTLGVVRRSAKGALADPALQGF
jgi:hypothetical protein